MRVFLKKHKKCFFLCVIGILLLTIPLLYLSLLFVPVATVDKEYDTLYYHGTAYTKIDTEDYGMDSGARIGTVENGASPLERLLFPLELFPVKNDKDRQLLILHGKDPYFQGVYCLQDELQTVEKELREENPDAEYVGELDNKTVPIDAWVGEQLKSVRDQADDTPSTVVVFHKNEEEKVEHIAIKEYVLNRCFYHFLSGSIRKYDNVFYYVKKAGDSFPPKQSTYDWFPLPEELQNYLSGIF